MTDRSNLVQQAEQLRQQAARETDQGIRERLIRMADHYLHLAESQGWTETHPTSAASVADIFAKHH